MNKNDAARSAAKIWTNCQYTSNHMNENSITCEGIILNIMCEGILNISMMNTITCHKSGLQKAKITLQYFSEKVY